MASVSVSLAIPLWEPKPRHLASLLASIRRQAHDQIEVVIVDDGDSPGLDQLVVDSGIATATVIRNPTRLGMVENWNAAAARLTGELVMVLGQDDLLGDTMIERYVAEFEASAAVVACSAGEEWIGDEDQPIEVPRRPNRRERIFVDHERYVLGQDELVRLCLRNGQVYGEPSAVMFRRTAFEAIGGYRAEFGHVADLDLDLRLAGEGPVVYLRAPLVHRRVHRGMATVGQQATGETADARERLHREWIGHPTLSERDRSRARVSMASWAARDVVKAAAHRRWPVARRQLGVVRRYALNPPGPVIENLVELVTRRNCDAR